MITHCWQKKDILSITDIEMAILLNHTAFKKTILGADLD